MWEGGRGSYGNDKLEPTSGRSETGHPPVTCNQLKLSLLKSFALVKLSLLHSFAHRCSHRPRIHKQLPQAAATGVKLSASSHRREAFRILYRRSDGPQSDGRHLYRVQSSPDSVLRGVRTTPLSILLHVHHLQVQVRQLHVP